MFSIVQKLVHPADVPAHMRLVLPRPKGMLQMTARVQRLGPDLLFHVPAEAADHLLGFAPHALAPDLVVEEVRHLRRVRFVGVGVQEGRPDRLDRLVVADVSAVVVFGVVLDHAGGSELLVVHLRVA